jgi:hypothetical protein
MTASMAQAQASRSIVTVRDAATAAAAGPRPPDLPGVLTGPTAPTTRPISESAAACRLRRPIVARAVERVLIGWDWGAHGIWTILSPRELAAPRTRGTWQPLATEVEAQRPRAWSDRLSVELLDALQEWNELGAHLFGTDFDETAVAEHAAFYALVSCLSFSW